MCTVSMIGDYYNDKWEKERPKLIPNSPFIPTITPFTTGQIPIVSREEFEALKKEVLEMKELLKRAVEYDKKNNQPNCEMEEKIALLKKVAEYVGVSLDDVFKKE